jgi:hypothetical protein
MSLNTVLIDNLLNQFIAGIIGERRRKEAGGLSKGPVDVNWTIDKSVAKLSAHWWQCRFHTNK